METRSIVLAGLPGKMASCVGERIAKTAGYELAPFGLGSEDRDGEIVKIGGRDITLYSPNQRRKLFRSSQITPQHLVIDYTSSQSANSNALFYAENGINFVIGTSGLDRAGLEKTLSRSGACAVAAPNMDSRVVAFQYLLDRLAEEKPGCLKNYVVRIIESHPSTKLDVSATAKAMIKPLGKLGIDVSKKHFAFKTIEMFDRLSELKNGIGTVRDPRVQRSGLRVPVRHLQGHAWHRYSFHPIGLAKGYNPIAEEVIDFLRNAHVFEGYTIKEVEGMHQMIWRESRHSEVFFMAIVDREKGTLQISQDINGRNSYVDGTMQALSYLSEKVDAGEKGRLFSMADVVLKEAA